MPGTTLVADRTFADRAARRPGGPGLPESCLWACGYLLAQALVAGGVIALLLFAAYGRLPDDKAESLALLLDPASPVNK